MTDMEGFSLLLFSLSGLQETVLCPSCSGPKTSEEHCVGMSDALEALPLGKELLGGFTGEI